MEPPMVRSTVKPFAFVEKFDAVALRNAEPVADGTISVMKRVLLPKNVNEASGAAYFELPDSVTQPWIGFVAPVNT